MYGMTWFVDRVVNIGGGLVQGVWQAPMFGVDIARSFRGESEYEGFMGTISGSFIDRGSEALQNLIGPDRGLGAAIGAIPEPLGVRQLANGVLDGMEWAYKEGVSQPLSTLMTMASIAESEGMDTWFEGERWGQAYDIAQTRSLGQAVMLGLGTHNILDERAVARHKLTDSYWWTTGLIDAVSVIRLDPAAVVGRGVLGARAGGTGPLEQTISRGTALFKGNAKIAFRGTAEEASYAANLKMTAGGMESQKVDAFVNSLRRVRDGLVDDLTEGIQTGVQGDGIFELYLNASTLQRKTLRSQLWNVSKPRTLADGGGVINQLDDLTNSPRFQDVDTAMHGLAKDLVAPRTTPVRNFWNQFADQLSDAKDDSRRVGDPKSQADADVNKAIDEEYIKETVEAIDDLADDDLIWVFHGTVDKKTAQAVADSPEVKIPKKRRSGTSGVREGEEVVDGLYVTANADVAATFGENITGMLVRKGDIEIPLEGSRVGSTFGQTMSDGAGGFLREGKKPIKSTTFENVRRDPQGRVPRVGALSGEKGGISTAASKAGVESDIATMATRIRHTILNSEKSTGGVGQAAEVLARAYVQHPTDFQLHKDVWRGLLGDQSVLAKMHKDLQGILKIKGTLVGDVDRVALAELMKSHMVAGRVRRTTDDADSWQQTMDFIIDNEDVYPSEILADLVEAAMLRGDDELANLIVDAADEMKNVGRLEDSFRGPKGGKPRGKDATALKRKRAEMLEGSKTKFSKFVDDARMDTSENVGVGWNEARLDALMEEAGRGSVVAALFTPKARAVLDEGDMLNNAPQLRNIPRVRPHERRRYSATLQSDASMRPFRMFTNMMPHRVIDLADDKSDAQIQRMLTQVRMDKRQAQELRGRYMMADTAADRMRIFEEAERASFETLATRRGMDPQDVQIVLEEVKIQKHISYRALESKNLRYDADLDRHFVRLQTPDELIEYPIMVTQTSKHVAVPDWRNLDRAVRRRSKKIKRHQDEMELEAPEGATSAELDKVRRSAAGQAVQLSEEAIHRRAVRRGIGSLDAVMRVWTPAVLLRPAWTMKVVMVDERIRQFAKFNGMVSWMDQMNMARNSFHDLYKEFASNGTPSMRMLGVDRNLTTGQSMRRSAGIAAVMGGAVAGPVGIGIGAAIGGGLGRNFAKKLHQVDALPHSLSRIADGVEVQAAFGDGVDAQNIWKELVSVGTSAQFRALRGHTDNAELLMRDFRATGAYESILPTNQTNWGKAMEETFNNQLGQDTAVRRTIESIADKIDNGEDIDLLKDDVSDELATWMKTTREGKKYSDQLPARSFDDEAMEVWSDVMTNMLYDYLAVDGRMGGLPGQPRDTTLIRKLVDPDQGRVTADEWKGQFERLETLPPIHGAAISESLNTSGLSMQISDAVESAFQVLGRIPSDTLSRQPMFNHLYRLEMRRLLNSRVDEVTGARTHLTKTQLAQLQRNAREYALTETRQVMYELAESSEFGEMARMVMPFFSAWQEALTRYAGLAYENPLFAARATRGFDSFVMDEDGARSMQFTLPEWAKGLANEGLIFKGAFDNNRTLKLNMDSLNMVAQGLPGTGPIVQYPLSRAAAKNPEIESSLKWLFPYGPPESFTDSFLPAYLRRAKSAYFGESDRAFASQLRRNLKTRMVRMESGEIPWTDMEDPLAAREWLEELEEETAGLMRVRTFASFVSPVTTSFDSPYQMFIESYRELQDDLEVDDADEAFLDLYGQDLFALTTSVSRTVNGIPPTLHGIKMEDKYQDLIDVHPDLGRLIVGEDSGGLMGGFVRSKYLDQFEEGDRELRDPNEMATTHTTNLAWMQYSRFLDYIEWERNERALPNLRVKEAEDLAIQKRDFVQHLAETNPGWAADFYEIDRGKWDRRIAGLDAISRTPGLGALDDKGMSRPDLAPLRQYLAAREYVVTELEQRAFEGGAATLSSVANVDLAEYWEDFTNDLVERNLPFADLFYRYLDNDPVRGPLAGLTNQGSL